MSAIDSGPVRTVLRYGDILAALRKIAPTAHIAGGAVRDTILERPIKDIDIFLPDVHIDDAATRLRSEFGYVKVGEWKEYEGFSDPSLARVAKFEKADETIPICLIGLKGELTAEENIARFDFGICMAALDVDGRLFSADEFKRDAELETFTLSRADNYPQFVYSMSRFKKLTADRYAGWKLAVPSQFKELADEYAVNKCWFTDGDHYGMTGEHANMLHPKMR